MTQIMTVDAPDTVAAWESLLSSVHAAHGTTKIPFPLSVFNTRVGGRYTGELLVVGRAINGWPPDVGLTELATEEARRAVVERDLERSREADPLGFVHREWRQRSGRSAFWRMLWRVCDALDVGGEEDWATHLAWTHLYRVTGQRTGNPSAPLSRLQRTDCVTLLRADLEQLAPERVLFLTGQEWAEPFVEALDVTLSPSKEVGVHAAGTWKRGQVVVADHPQCRPEVPMAQAIAACFDGLA